MTNTNTKMNKMLELSDKNFKIDIIHMLPYSQFLLEQMKKIKSVSNEIEVI